MLSNKNSFLESNIGRKRIGFCLSAKKKRNLKKLNFQDFVEYCSKKGMELVEVNVERSLEDQGPFDVVVQKIVDYMAAANEGDTQAINAVKNLETYTRLHPNVIVLDPLDSVRKLCNRTISYQVMKECEFTEQGVRVYVPNFVQIDTLDFKHNLKIVQIAGVRFPLMCKSVIGHGSNLTHKMALIFNEEGLKDIIVPCVLQTFVNHNAVLYKVFIAGNKHYIVQRPSIKNFYGNDNQETIFFNTMEVSKSDSTSDLVKLDESDGNMLLTPPDVTILSKLVKKLQDKLGLSLFGIDVFVENGTQNHVVIDINYFPGYDGAPTFFSDLADYIHSLVNADATQINCTQTIFENGNMNAVAASLK